MSATEIDTVVLLFPNEDWSSTATDTELNAVVAQLRSNISYALFQDDNLQTLSTHDADQSGTIGGFLYVPDLNRDDPCYNLSNNYVPRNVTRRANLPPTDFTLIAIAPWINVNCTLSYLAAASRDPIRGFIFYLPNNGTAQPPPPSSPIWELGDAGSWKSRNPYPVYAVPSDIGQEMIHQSSLYSGNMTSVPFGHQISELPGIDPTDFVRMYTQIHTTNSSVTPSLWFLLLVIVAILLVMLAATSGAMHLIQRSRRKSLQRRVANGEVNLEALGIKRLTVPREYINRLPLFTYNVEDEEVVPCTSTRTKNKSASPSSNVHDDLSERSSPSARRAPISQEVQIIDDTVSSPDSAFAHTYLPYSQPTCPICLDDFESRSTPIRELPCGHIFHPRCIDAFLSNNSSLCPMCKKSVLPKGCCPTKITNAMVHRERNIRRLQSRVMINDEEGDVEPDNMGSRTRRYKASLRGGLFHSSTTSGNSEQTFAMPMVLQPVLMTNAMPETQISVLGNEVPDNLAPGLTRQDIAQQRMQEIAAEPAFHEEPNVINSRRWLHWTNAVSRVFPVFE